MPDLTFVLGYTGKKSNTGREVAKVRRFVTSNAFGREIVNDIGVLTQEALKKIRDRDVSNLI